MFETQESTPWYRSRATLVGASLLLLILLGTGYFFAFRRSSTNDAHYAALEQQRAQQRAEAEAQAAANSQAPAGVAVQPAVPGQPGASPAPGTSSETASAHAARNYWTNFRGPNRDGRYDEMAVLTNWPAQGLSLLWKQPAGLGYASFTIADGRAYTIEQRRQKEVVAAYDVNTGRELWLQGWNAE